MQKYAALLFVVWSSSVGVAAGQDQQLPAGWTQGPVVGRLGTKASISLPEGYVFLDRNATRHFLEENQNIPDGDELGIVLRIRQDEHWFAVFSYSETGHIDNSERNSLDPDDLMTSMRDGNNRSNEQRKKRGWTPLLLIDWHQRPFYDHETDNLTWATLLASDDESVINHSVRLLGRTGLMSVQLVADPSGIEAATSEFNEVLKSYSFNDGQRYAEFRQGDKLAGYGLAALIAGGAGAAAVKTGVLQKLWKVLVLGFVGLVGAIKKLFSAFGKSGDRSATATASSGQTD